MDVTGEIQWIIQLLTTSRFRNYNFEFRDKTANATVI